MKTKIDISVALKEIQDGMWDAESDAISGAAAGYLAAKNLEWNEKELRTRAGRDGPQTPHTPRHSGTKFRLSCFSRSDGFGLNSICTSGTQDRCRYIF
jgi:hypothetical protein